MEEQALIRGVNWAPNSSDEEEDQITPMPTPWKNDVADAEEEAVADAIAMEEAVVDDVDLQGADNNDAIDDASDVALALLQLASTEVSTFESHRDLEKVSQLMLPVLFLEHDEASHGAATKLVWFSHGYVKNYREDRPLIHNQDLNDDKLQEVTMSVWKIFCPMLYGNIQA